MTDSHPNPAARAIEWCEGAGYRGGAPPGSAAGAVYLRERMYPVCFLRVGEDLVLDLGLPVPPEALRGTHALSTDRLAHLVDHTAALRSGRMAGQLRDGPEGLAGHFVRTVGMDTARGGVLDALADLDRCRLDFLELVELDLAAASARRATADLTRELSSLADEIDRTTPDTDS